MKKHKQAIKIELKTNRQAGDIAGTKLRKFSNFFISQLKRYFEVSAWKFDYDEDKNIGKIMLVVKQKKEIIFPGPPITMADRIAEFKKEHKNVKIKQGKAYAFEKSMNFNDFLRDFQKASGKVISSMGVGEIKN